MQKIGEIVRIKRMALGISQKRLAKESGVSRSYIIEIEEGKYNVSISILCELCKVLKCTPNDLIPIELYT